MDKMNQKMKKLVNIRGVLDGFRTSASTSPKGSDYEVEERLRSEHFQVAKTVRHGFPYQPTAMAFDPVQNLLAIGTKSGSLRIFGRPGVDCCVQHERDVAVIQILFLVNEGFLVSVCSDDTLYLWTLKKKVPEVVHYLTFKRERITQCDLPFQSKWLYIGTERGNVHIVNIESFVLSGYVINWNKAIELSRKTHPGPVVHLSDNPMDSTKLLIGFECGAIVLWDLKTKTAECRFNCSEALRSVAWHHEGKQFMCSHSDGSLSTWNIKEPKKPASVFLPHAKIGKDGKPEPCKPISKLEWKTVRNAEPYVIFSGGMPYDKASRTPSLTVIQAKSTTVLEMEHNVVDFLTLCSTPYNNDFQDPYGIVVLLQNDLVVVDLTSPGYPCFENPYPMDIHESPVTACQYFADCPTDLIPAFYSVGAKQKRTEGFSEKDWPVKGGEWGQTTQSYPEIMITGHADGSLKFWDASMSTLQVLYKLKTAKVFDKSKCKSPDSDDDPFAIQHIQLCLESRLLVVAGITHLMLFRFSKQESSTDPTILEINIVYEIYDDIDSPEECIYPPNPPPKPALGSTQSGSIGSYSSNASDGKESQASVKVKTGSRKWSAGYQPDLVGVITWIDGEPPPPITAISVNSHYGLLAFGNDCGLAIVDTVQKTCLLNMGTPDLYGSMDPYSRVPRSPKSRNQPRPGGLDGLSQPYDQQECKSPTGDQSSGTAAPGAQGSGAHGPPPPRPPPPVLPSSPTARGMKRPQSHGLQLEAIVESSQSQANRLQDQQIKETNRAKRHSRDDDWEMLNAQTSTESESSKSRKSTTTSSQSSVEECFEATEELMDSAESKASKKKGQNEATGAVDCEDIDALVAEFEKIRKESEVRDVELETQYFAQQADNDNSDGCETDGVVNTSTNGTVSFKPKKPLGYSKSLPVHTQTNSCDISNDSQHLPISTSDAGGGVTTGSQDSLLNKDGSENSAWDKEKKDLSKKKRGGSFFNKFRNKDKDALENKSDQTTVSNRTSHSEYDLLGGESGRTPDNTDQIDSSNKRDNQGGGIMRRLSKMVKNQADDSDDCGGSSSGTPRKRKSRLEQKICFIDLSMEDVPKNPPNKKMTYGDHCHVDKGDGSFSRSRSSSISSLENISKEAITAVVFADSYCRKTDAFTSPSLYVGTNLGSCLVIVLQLPQEGEQRKTQPVIVSPSGTIFRLQGAILAMAFLDSNGLIIQSFSDQWRDEKEKKYTRQQSVSSMKAGMSPTSSTDQNSDRQFGIICSEKHARVMSLPSQTCAYKVKITDTSVVCAAEVVTVKDMVYLATYVANGHILTFSLPSLKPMLDVDFLPSTDIRVAKTFSFSHSGHALYFCSPTEVQKITLSADISVNLNEMLGELFLACETPEAPKQGFFKNLFGQGTPSVDREELFGESSGKASRGVATKTVGSAGMATAQEKAQLAGSEIGRAKLAAMERGEKLGQLEDRTEHMRNEAEQFAHNAHLLMNKYKDKKWYQF